MMRTPEDIAGETFRAVMAGVHSRYPEKACDAIVSVIRAERDRADRAYSLIDEVPDVVRRVTADARRAAFEEAARVAASYDPEWHEGLSSDPIVAAKQAARSIIGA